MPLQMTWNTNVVVYDDDRKNELIIVPQQYSAVLYCTVKDVCSFIGVSVRLSRKRMAPVGHTAVNV